MADNVLGSTWGIVSQRESEYPWDVVPGGQTGIAKIVGIEFGEGPETKPASLSFLPCITY